MLGIYIRRDAGTKIYMDMIGTINDQTGEIKAKSKNDSNLIMNYLVHIGAIPEGKYKVPKVMKCSSRKRFIKLYRSIWTSENPKETEYRLKWHTEQLMKKPDHCWQKIWEDVLFSHIYIMKE